MEYNKHAYLILAHNEFVILDQLIACIDDIRNDIYIHFDAKVKSIPVVKTQFSKLDILKDRVNVFWGDSSMIEAEYKLFEAAKRTGSYTYYHLISGVDLPLKSQKVIHEFFNKNSGKEFVGFIQNDRNKEIKRRVGTHHIFTKYFRNDNSITYWIAKILRFVFNTIQRFFGVNRNNNIEFKMGPQWVSITDQFVTHLLNNKEHYCTIFKSTYCSDELFMQTAIWNSKFKDSIYNISHEFEGCSREINWVNGQLIPWKINDMEYLLKSNACFARKFDSKNIDLVYELKRIITTNKS